MYDTTVIQRTRNNFHFQNHYIGDPNLSLLDNSKQKKYLLTQNQKSPKPKRKKKKQLEAAKKRRN